MMPGNSQPATVYRISGNCVGGGYTESITEYNAKETNRSYIWPGRRLNKVEIDCYQTHADGKVTAIYTDDPMKVPMHLNEMRRRFREHLLNEKMRAAESEGYLAVQMAEHKAHTWREMVKKG